MAYETTVQAFVHALEEGKWATRIRIGVLVAIGIALYTFFIFNEFRGLSSPRGMEQAVCAREIARGNGFTTKVIRPAAYFQLQQNRGIFPVDKTPETYHAPLNPLVNALFLWPLRNKWVMSTKDIVYVCDRMIAGVSLAFFLLAVLVTYFTAKRLFDQRLALFACGLLLICERFYTFATSGLPQMLMLLLFCGALHLMVRAIEARHAGRSPLVWLVGAALLFGLLALTHGLTMWMFGGALIFAGLYFRPYGKYAAIMLGVFLLLLVPWWVYNFRACGSIAGISVYSAMFQIRGEESAIMRTLDVSFGEWNPAHYRNKVTGQAITQIQDLYRFCGGIIVAPFFLLAVMHLFKRPETGATRWCVFCIGLAAFLGMCVFGFSDKVTGTPANDLYLLLLPITTVFGLALVMVFWARLNINLPLLRYALIAVISLVSGLPMINALIGEDKGRIHWPPYVPPVIANFSDWTNPDEIIMSDMPWAVAWYADRKSLWLPMSVSDFITLNDWNQLGGKIVGLYLTPISGDAPLLKGVIKGEYKEWAPFILRSVTTRDFPLRAVTALPLDGECVFYADRDRWSRRTD